jgi:hypothetical protein
MCVRANFGERHQYLWKAAWCFHHDADPAAEPWVAAHALKLLAGDVDAVIGSLGQQATDAGLTSPQRGGSMPASATSRPNESSWATAPPCRPVGRSPQE